MAYKNALISSRQTEHKKNEVDKKSTSFLLVAFRLNINPWFYQGWVKKPWQIKTSMLR